MGMIADVILTVAEIAVAAGAVAEFQLRIGGIGSAADCAAVGVVAFSLGLTAGEGDRAGLPGRHVFRPTLSLPGIGNQIPYIPSKENKVVGKTNQGKQALGIAADLGCGCDNLINQINEVEQRHQPGLDGDKIEKQKLCIRVQSGKTDNQAQIKEKRHISGKKRGAVQLQEMELSFPENPGKAAEHHTENVHQKHTGKIVQIKLKGTHSTLYRSA